MARLLFLQNIEYEFLGPMYISAMARAAGHECRLAIGTNLDDFRNPVEEFAPDLVGFSVMSGSHRWALNTARAVRREYGVRNIFGGAHPTFFPDFVEEDGVDLILRGEGEESTVEVLNRLDDGAPLCDIPNVWFKNGHVYRNDVRPLHSDLDAYPFPDRTLYDALEGRLDRSVRNVITSRGCPWHCSFCFEDAMRDLYRSKGKYVRLRSIDGVLDECRALKASTDVRTIYFADDVFGMSTKWLYEFLPRYRAEVGLPFICLVRADIVCSNDEYASRLAEGGCSSVFFGVESGNEDLRNNVLAKRLTDRQIETAALRLHDAGIPFRTYNITGLPGETIEDALSTVALNIRMKTDYPWCSVYAPFPGTALAETAVAQGYLNSEFSPEMLTRSFFTESPICAPDIRRMQNLQKFFQTAVLWPWTLPFIKRLIGLPPNMLFTAWFGLVYFFVYLQSERRGFWRTLRFAMHNYRHLLAKQ